MRSRHAVYSSGMKPVTFITGNLNKVAYVEKYLGYPVKHISIDLDEIQSLDLKKIVEHKVRQAYEKIKEPVLVEDGSLAFEALGGLPGPFIKFFIENLSYEAMCRMVDGKSRKATARVIFGYFDGKEITFFESELNGEVAQQPSNNGWAWDKIFIPEGYKVARGDLSEEEYEKSASALRPLAPLKAFLERI
jgi:inosine triphosphate pyrophosphatase